LNLLDLKNRIQGPVFPIVTPFTRDHRVDYEKIRDYIDFLYDGGARIFHIMVHTSRFGLLSCEEMLEVNSCVCRHVKKQYSDCIVIVSDPLYKPTNLSIEFARRAEEEGADLIGLIFMERYYFEDQAYDFFETVADSCGIGILIHEQQMNTIHGAQLMPFPLDLLNRIAEIDNVIAIKEDAKEDEYTEKAIRTLKDKLAIIVSGGSKEQFMKFGPLGCQAYLVGIASFDPQVATIFYDAYCAGDVQRCWQIIKDQEQPFFEVAKALGWHVGLKSALEILKIMVRTERPPLKELPDKEHEKIKNVLSKIGYAERLCE
jgi:4-hydroxy-tetrahydrodipicolinate synthase